MPLITPVEEFSPMPVGNVPAVSAQLYGVVPPVADSVAEYGTFTCPLGKLVVVIDSAAGVTVTIRDPVALFDVESVTFAVKPNVPAAVGVPERTPPVESVSPPGRVPLETAQL